MPNLLPLLGLVCFAAAVSPAASPQPAGDAPVASEPVRDAGLKVAVDPETGEITSNPTYKQLERLSDGDIAIEPRRSSWELREFSLRAGGRGVFLDGWADHSLRIEIGDDGALRPVCSQGDKHDEAGSAERADER